MNLRGIKKTNVLARSATLLLLLLGVLVFAKPVKADVNYCDKSVPDCSCPGCEASTVDVSSNPPNYGCTSGAPTYLGCLKTFSEQQVCCGPAVTPGSEMAKCEDSVKDPLIEAQQCVFGGDDCPAGFEVYPLGSCGTASNKCCVKKKDVPCTTSGINTYLKLGVTDAKCGNSCDAGYKQADGNCVPGLVCCVKGGAAATDTKKPAAATAREGFNLPSTGSFQTILGRVIKIILGISGSLALASIMYGGFLWLTSGGSVETITKARNIIVWAALGLVVIFASYAIVSTVFDIVSQATGTQILQVSP